jgi:peroxiredoxin
MGANINGWTTNRSSSFAEFYGGSVNPGETINFVIQVSTGANESPTANWKVEANDVMSSGGVTSCGGSLGTEISGMTDVEAPIISDLITISEVTSTSVKISWTTNEVATSEIFYSANDAYDLEKKDLTLKTNHGLTLDGLTVNTSYYFYVVSTDGGGNSSSSNFASFTTAVTNSNVGTTQTIVVTTTTTTSSPTPTSRPLVDTVAPVVNISTDFSKPFKIAPTINGKAIDGGAVNVGVVGVEYSLDNGKNWLPVDSIDNVGKKSVSFEFTPVGLDDGNYLIKMRAKDSTGNVGLSKTYTMVIDRLPPQVGGSLFTLGPMILKPDSSGNIYSIAGMEIKVILSAVGGPINMDLFFDLDKFSLVKNEESGLWSGLINTGKIGTFQLVTKSIDGAKNETERKLSKIVALKAGKIVDENNKAISKARIKIYTFEKSQNDFTLWESEPYMQTNPQESDENGEYRLILPPGKYYLEIEVRGKRKLRSEIFELQTATPINQDFNLEKALFWGNWWAKTVSMNIVSSQEVNSNEVKNDLVGKMIPDFDLSNQNSEFSSTSVLGKPSVMTFISSWEPQSSDQLLELDQFKSENDGVNVAAVVTQESVSKVDIFKKVGGYKIPIIADPDGILVVPLNLESLPTHIFLDRKGMIKDMYVGFLNKDSLLKRILN